MKILITGGTGTLGRALVKHYYIFTKEKVAIYSRCEFKQSEMMKEYRDDEDRIRWYIGDVRDIERLNHAVKGVDLIIHAAAMKQVPACEYNPAEAIATNITGTANVIRAALDNDVPKVLYISTDKAVAPINLYGATKFASEKMIVNANQYSGWGKTKFSCVRYGNVMGSRGSVLDTFKSNTTGIYPLTDHGMTRFYMTVSDAVNLVDYASHAMGGGEIYIPKMKAYKIADMIRAINPEAEYDIIGIRSGEKLHEEMFNENDKRNLCESGPYYCVNYGRKEYKKIEGFDYNSGSVEQMDCAELRAVL